MVAMLQPFAWPQDFTSFAAGQELVQNTEVWSDAALLSLLTRATRSIESRCQRRLAPFSGKQESHMAMGIDPNEYGQQSGMPMDLTGALGWSQAASMGVSDMVRKFWLDENPPMYQEYWTYTMESLEILRTFGDTQTFSGSAFTTLQGPEYDTGLVRMQIGTYCPLGSTIRVTYGGGYSVIPDDLQLACIYQATKMLLLGAEPEMRGSMGYGELDDEIRVLIAPYARF